MSDAQRKPLIIIGADHGGFVMKQSLSSWLKEQEYQVKDCGAFQLAPADDYPVFAQAVAQELIACQKQNEPAFGVLLCRSGAGMVMAANRFSAIRAAGVMNTQQAVHARAHNDANVIVLSGDWMQEHEMKECILTFLTTPFSAEERHVRRIAQLDTLI